MDACVHAFLQTGLNSGMFNFQVVVNLTAINTRQIGN